VIEGDSSDVYSRIKMQW